ncbi:MAG TPA: hypothetical protein VGC87_02695 [Pyrinomonadaceae bacterium]|jgi:hypothetical protein
MSTLSPRLGRASSLAALCLSLFAALAGPARAQAPQPTPTPQQPAAGQAAPQTEEWGDTFDGNKLDEAKWERYTFEGGNGGKFEVKEGQLHMRGIPEARAGVRSRQEFTSDRFIVEANLARVGPMMPLPEEAGGGKPGNAILAVLFDGSAHNRIEWLMTSEGIFEAWVMTDGRGERIDNRRLGTKLKNPIIAIARRGDDFLFILNGPDSPPQNAQVGLTKTIKNMPKTFRVMLYGFGTSENNWDSVRVTTVKQP